MTVNTLALSVLKEIRNLSKHRLIIALDGRCASGKTTLAAELQRVLPCNVFHMDDFYLQPQQRTPERLQTPGGNIDVERFLCEVLEQISTGQPFSYRPYSCTTGTFAPPVSVLPQNVNLIEGSYACHPLLWDSYDFRIFLMVSPEEQLSRIRNRNGIPQAEIFRTRWIPMEEAYFSAFRIMPRCDLILASSQETSLTE